MAKYNNIPSYVKNLKRSGKNMIIEQARSLMPGLSDTIASSRDIYKEIRSFDKDYGRRYANSYVSRNKNLVFGPLKDFVHNMKEDLKSGKFYNEERMLGDERNGIDQMLGGFGDIEDDDMMMSDSDLQNARITSKFDVYLKATTNSLSNRSLSNSLNEVNINNTDYIANVNTLNNSKIMALTSKHHIEQMAQLKNLETIGMSMMKFNEEIIAAAIERQDKFHEDILQETRELKDLIREQTEFNMSRFKSGTNNAPKGSPIMDIVESNGSINIKNYLKNIKGNVSNKMIFGVDDFSMLAKSINSSPISFLAQFLLQALIPKDIKKNIKDIDKSMAGLFGAYLLKMNDVKYNGKNSFARSIAEILGVDMKGYNKPNLGGYRNQDLTLEIEQKKAKAITEVIPAYLNDIASVLTGRDKLYDYNRGIFLDRTKRKQELDKEWKNTKIGNMYDTRSALVNNMYNAKMSRSQYNFIEDEIDNLMEFMADGNDFSFNSSYTQLKRKGLKLNGGEKSFNIIKGLFGSLSDSQRMHIKSEQLSSLGRRSEQLHRRGEMLFESGNSAYYNGYRDNVRTSRGRSYSRGYNSRYKLRKSSSFGDSGFDVLNDDDIIAQFGVPISSEERKARQQYVSGKKEDPSILRETADRTKQRFRGVFGKILQKYVSKGGAINTFLLGINEGLHNILYGEDKTGMGIVGRISDFTANIFSTTKEILFGSYDEEGNQNKEGVLPKEIAKVMEKYLPKAKNGAIIGGLLGLVFKHPLIGATTGAALNILAETDKVKSFLWGDPNDPTQKGIFGGIRDKLNEKVIDPLKNYLKDKFKDKFNETKDKVKNGLGTFFDVNDDNNRKGSKRYRIISGSLQDIQDNINYRRSNRGLAALSSEMERGIYSDQLDTIISLLSGGLGYYEVIGWANIGSSPNSSYYKNIQKAVYNRAAQNAGISTSQQYALPGGQRLVLPEGRTGDNVPLHDGSVIILPGEVGASSNKNKRRSKMTPKSRPTQRSSSNNVNDVPIMSENEIINEVTIREVQHEIENNPSLSNIVKSIGKKTVSSMKGIFSKNSSNASAGNTSNSSSERNSMLGNLGTSLLERLNLKEIGKGRGGLIGFALGSMLLANPILGAVAGMTFSGKSKEQKELEKAQGGNQYKVGRTALKYAALAPLFGINPMLGLLAGALIPEKKKNKNNPNAKPGLWEKAMGGSSLKGRMLGGLAGMMMGGVPGMMIGAIAGGKLVGRQNRLKKDDIKYKQVVDEVTGQVELVERTKEEQKQYIKEQKELKRIKTTKGTFIDKLTGGGKIRGTLFGSLAGAAISGLPGLLIGGLAGGIGSTSNGKLNRNRTGGILSSQGSWKGSIIGALIGNALMGPILGPLVGGLAGELLTKKQDQKFWRYDKYGNRLNREQTKIQKQRFKNEYKYKRDYESHKYDMWLYNNAKAEAEANGEEFTEVAPDIYDSKYNIKRGFWESQKKKREIMKRENDKRDKNQEKGYTGKKYDLEKFEIFQQSKAKGGLRGAQIGAVLGGPLGALLGAGAGIITSGKKNKQPDGTARKPFYVKDASKAKDEKKSGSSSSTPSGNNSTNYLNNQIDKIVNADTNGGDAKAEDEYKKSIKKINDSNMSPEEKAKAIDQLSSTSTAMKTSSAASVLSGESEKSGGFLSSLLSGLASFILPAITSLIGTLLKGNAGHGTENVYGDAMHGNLGDKVIHGGKLLGGHVASKILQKAGLSKLGGASVFQAVNAASAASYYGNEAKAYSDQGDSENAAEATYGAVTNAGKAGWYGVKAAKAIGKTKAAQVIGTGVKKVTSKASGKIDDIVKGVKTFLGKLFKDGKVKKLLGKNGDNVAGKVLPKITSFITEKLGKNLLKKGAAFLGKILSKIGQIASVVLAWLPLITAVTAFINGWNNVNNELQLSSDYKPAWWERLVCALVYALDDFLCGAIDIFGLRDDLISILIKLFGGEKKANELNASKVKASSEYEKFLQENDLSRDAFTMEQYQNITNKTIWGHTKSLFGFGESLDDYKKGGKKYDKLKEKYGGYTSTSNAYTPSTSTISSVEETANGMNNVGFDLSSTNGLLQQILQGINNLTNSAYVVQNNQKTINVIGGADASSVTGGRGRGSAADLLRANARKTKIISISDNKDPEEVLMDVTSNKEIQNLFQVASESQDGFMSDPRVANNKNIKVKPTGKTKKLTTSKSFGEKVWDGVKSLGSNAVKGAKAIGGVVVSGAKAVGKGLYNFGKSAYNLGKNVVTSIGKGIGNFASRAWNVITGGRGEDPDYYNQQDPRWSNMSFGIYNNKRDTVGDGGCGPTTAATVLQKMTGRKITPAETSRFALQNGYKLDNGGTTPDYFSAVGAKYGVNMSQSLPMSKNTIDSLRNGEPVIFLGSDMTGTSPFGSDGHYVIGTGMDKNGNVNILDPKNSSNNRLYNIKDIIANSTRTIVSGGRGSKLWGRDTSVDRSQWISIVRSVKAAIASQIGHYSQNEKHNISVNGTTISVRPDCSGFVSACLQLYGVTNKMFNSSALTASTALEGTGFTYRPWSSWNDLSEGDIIAKNGHVEIFCRNDGNKHYVYNVGSNNSAGVSSETSSNKSSYTTVWSPGESGTYKSQSSSSSTGGLMSKLSGILDTITISSGGLDNILSGISSAFGDSTTSATSNVSKTSTTTGTIGTKSASFGTTSRNGTISVPAGLGTQRTYMGWQCITSKSSDQYKLREDAGMRFDDLGYGKIDDRYVVAMTNTFGNVGDYVDIHRSDGSVLKAVIGDIKRQSDSGANQWGHDGGKTIEEFIVNKDTWYKDGKGNHSNPGSSDDNHPEWKGLDVVKVENLGNYWGRGSNPLNKKLNKLKNKNPFGGRGKLPFKNNKPVTKAKMTQLSKQASNYGYSPIVKPKSNYGGRGMTPIPTTSSVIDALSMKSHNSIMTTISDAYDSNSNQTSATDAAKLDEGNRINTAILNVLKGIAMTLERIERNSATMGNSLSNISYGGRVGGGSTVETYKASMMNSIVSGN